MAPARDKVRSPAVPQLYVMRSLTRVRMPTNQELAGVFFDFE